MKKIDKYDENQWKLMNIVENLWKMMKIDENR